MFSPYEYYPFSGQYSDEMYNYYPGQVPYGMYDDINFSYISPEINIRQNQPLLSNNPATFSVTLF